MFAFVLAQALSYMTVDVDGLNAGIAERSVERALALGLVPTLCLGLATGVFLSLRAQRRVEQVNSKIQRIVAGELRERLPTRGGHDPFDKLAVLVNGMLDEIEALIRSIA